MYTLPFRFSLLAFGLGILSNQTLFIAGTIKLGEVLATSYFLVGQKHLAISKIPKPLVFSALAWSIAQALSDLVNETALSDAFKGIGAPLLLLLTLSGLTQFFVSCSIRLPSFLLGLACGGFINLYLNPTLYFQTGNQWKWGYGILISSFVLVIYSFVLQPRIKSTGSINLLDVFFLLIQVLLASIGLANDSRSALVSPILFLVYLFIRLGKLNGIIRFLALIVRQTPFHTLALTMSLFMMANIAISVILNLEFVHLFFPATTLEKTISQSSNQYGLLLGGRNEIFASMQAFLDKPILGHGSWPKDPNARYNSLKIDRLSQAGQNLSYDEIDYQIQSGYNLYIPAHSYLMGSLVWAGLFGGIFWICTLNFIVKRLLDSSQFIAFYFFSEGYSLIWGIFFSPFGYSTRFSVAVFMAALISIDLSIRAYHFPVISPLKSNTTN
jgi:hypothetical protein